MAWRAWLGAGPRYKSLTIHSLEALEEAAHQCSSLPQKGHMLHELYERMMGFCKAMEDFSRQLLLLEEERLSLENERSSLDERGEEYQVISEEYQVIIIDAILEIIGEAENERLAIFN